MDVGRRYGSGRVCVSGTGWLFNGMWGPDVYVPAEQSGCSTVCGEAGRVRVSGTGWQPGGIGLSGLGQRCGELIANCD